MVLKMLFKTHKDSDKNKHSELVLQVGWQLDPGLRLKDKPNEDNVFVIQGTLHFSSGSSLPFSLFVIADGMGGQANGQEASRIAGQFLVEHIQSASRSHQMTPETFLPLLKAGVQSANQVLYQQNQAQGTNLGTTMTAALITDTTAYVAHVGDSRLYLYHPLSGISQITHDHSLVAALVTAGTIQPDDIYTHPYRNLIYRCLGEKSALEVDVYTVPLTAGDTLLLCSDGLWEMVRDPKIADILSNPVSSAKALACTLIQAALSGGGEDNVSAIVVRILDQ